MSKHQFDPLYRITPHLLDLIKRITVLVHELNRRQISDLIHAELLSDASVTSTYSSTSIEGNPLPLTEVKRLLKTEPVRARQSELEVLNYNRMLAMLNQKPAYTIDSQQIFGSQQILEIHRGVMDGLLHQEHTGNWRQEPIVVRNPQSGDVLFLPPDYDDVPQLMEELIEFVQAELGRTDPLILAGLFHKQFVVIHPFVDGNGRTTRLATKQLLSGLGINLFPLLSFENYYNQNVTRYFQTVGVYGNYYDIAEAIDFTPWLEYFAEGILDELLRLQDQLESRNKRPDQELKAHHSLILELIDRHGFVTDQLYAKETERAKATRSLDFKRLVELGMIERKGRGRTTYYERKS